MKSGRRNYDSQSRNVSVKTRLCKHAKVIDEVYELRNPNDLWFLIILVIFVLRMLELGQLYYEGITSLMQHVVVGMYE